MFAGHIGAALAIGRAERRINVGLFVVAALWLDVLLWLFVLAGWESVTIGADFAATHQPSFVFPWSHGLLASAGWAALAGVAAGTFHPGQGLGRWRTAALIAAAVFSHWLLDALVHVPELPLAGPGSPKLGLGWWQHMPVALAAEALFVVAGLCLYLLGAGLSRARKLWLATLCLVLLAFTVAGMTIAPAPPSAAAMAASSLVTVLLVGAAACWIGAGPDMPQPR